MTTMDLYHVVRLLSVLAGTPVGSSRVLFTGLAATLTDVGEAAASPRGFLLDVSSDRHLTDWLL